MAIEEKKPLAQLILDRYRKLLKLEELGIDPFGRRFDKTHTTKQLHQTYGNLKPGETVERASVRIAGRLISKRIHGKAGFADLQDFNGKIQLYFRINELGKEKYKIFEKLLDVGDIIGVEGFVFRTHKGELSVWVKDFVILTKSLRPLPHVWFGLKDVERRYRERYVDLILNPSVKETFVKRSKIIEEIRKFLNSKGFIEVETPILQPIPGGANARPFITFHNALGINLYLRIATELHLKRLIVGGFEKVYEIGKVFRNEGIDRFHNPEFTSIEWYWAYADYRDNMKLVEELIKHLVKVVCEKLEITYQGKKIDFSKPFKVLTMTEAIKEYTGIDITGKTREELLELAKSKGLEIKEDASKGEIIATLFEELVQEKLIQPTFIIDHPVDVSPLAKRKKDDPTLTERFELYIAGLEIVNAYTELNDPIDQRERFLEQMEKRMKGDEEAHMMDEDFIRALEYGMPPTSGVGIGIDRLVMVLTDSPSIRDVILFPTLRPEEKIETFGDLVKDTTLKKKTT
ncbi:MAG: lysine--tRNA ligase [Candidatus Aenigmarchaeota archaeon]|nr:lysine--tRNA ligase [Candidatus Aenigmarchaeota archaeon]